MIETRTQSGTVVTLEGTEYCGAPVVRCRCVAQGRQVDFLASGFGSPGRNGDVRGILGWQGNQQVCLTVPEADYERGMAEARAIGEREMADLREGRTPIVVRWQEGSPLSGYTTSARAAQLLAGLGLASSVAGWGYLVSREVVETLGTSFAFEEAQACARPAREAREAEARHAEADRREKFAEAARTGHRVLLSQGSDECDGSVDECSLDVVYEWAMSDGTTKVERVHTH